MLAEPHTNNGPCYAAGLAAGTTEAISVATIMEGF